MVSEWWLPCWMFNRERGWVACLVFSFSQAASLLVCSCAGYADS